MLGHGILSDIRLALRPLLFRYWRVRMRLAARLNRIAHRLDAWSLGEHNRALVKAESYDRRLN